jgi:phospholipase/carboxylesterase
MTNIPTLTGPERLPRDAKPTSLVILLHGYGSNGADLIGLAPFWRAALPHTAFIAPNAPDPCPGAPGGYQWWSLESRTPQARAAGVSQPAAAINAFIDAQLSRFGLSEDRLALVGFSQGTMAALHVGPRRERPLAGILGYSGMLADADALATEVRSKPPVLLIHGDADPMVPVSALGAAASVLEGLGFKVATHVSPGLGHSIDDVGLDLGGQFLAEVLG